MRVSREMGERAEAMKHSLIRELEEAWRWRERQGYLQSSDGVRVFHGPGESHGVWRQWAIDRFGSGFWVTSWDDAVEQNADFWDVFSAALVEFLREKGARQVVFMHRPSRGLAPLPKTLWAASEAVPTRYSIAEGSMRFWVQLRGSRHPGLFLDHAPLRRWLLEHSNNLRVLNTFSYTGSLSVACGLGRAQHVTSLDLSQPAMAWAQQNWDLNGLPAERARWLVGDVFEWLPRFERHGERFDQIILDPPSFSRGKKGVFSTARDLTKLHLLAMRLLKPGGILISSLNSVDVTWRQYEQEVMAACRQLSQQYQVLWQIEQPETFLTLFGHQRERYLKGWVLKRVR